MKEHYSESFRTTSHQKGISVDDVVDRARQALSDHEWAKACKVAASPDRAYRLLAELVDEVERLRSGYANWNP